MYTIDFETYYSREYSLSKLTTEQYIRDPRFEVIGVAVKKDGEPTVFHPADPADWRGSIQKALDAYRFENEMVIAHNAAFDMAILNWHFNIRPRFIVDTLSMSRPVTMLTVGQSLRALAEFFGIGHKGDAVYNMLDVHLADMTPQQMYDYGEYCKLDVDLTYHLFYKLKDYSTPDELRVIDCTIRMFSEPILELDQRVLIEHLDEVRARNRKLLEATGMDNRDVLMSNQKFAEALRSLGVEPPMKVSATTGKETYAFSKQDLEFVELKDHPDTRVQALVCARLGLKSTIDETRTEAFIAMANRGNLPCMLTYYGGHTGRASGGDRVNVQNLPRGGAHRRAIKAPNGYGLVACDSSNIESRVLAWFAGQTDLVQEYRDGVDVYSSFASTVYNKPINKHDNPKERFVGKTCILGLGYGTGHTKLQHSLEVSKVKIPLDEAKRIVSLYRSRYFSIPILWKQADEAIHLMSQGYNSIIGVGIQLKAGNNRVMLPNGMSIFYNNLRTEVNPFTQKPGLVYYNRRKPVNIYGAKVIENIVQALARIVVFDQMLVVHKWLKAKEAKDGVRRAVCLMVHDEVVCCVPESEMEETKAFMEKAMSVAPTWAPDLPVACEAGVGYCYGDAK